MHHCSTWMNSIHISLENFHGIDWSWMADTLASLNPSMMLIVPDLPPFLPHSRPQPIREHRDQLRKETEGKEVASYMSRTCTRSIGAVIGAKNTVFP